MPYTFYYIHIIINISSHHNTSEHAGTNLAINLNIPYLSHFSCLLQNLHLPLLTSAGMVRVPLTLNNYHHLL